MIDKLIGCGVAFIVGFVFYAALVGGVLALRSAF